MRSPPRPPPPGSSPLLPAPSCSPAADGETQLPGRQRAEPRTADGVQPVAERVDRGTAQPDVAVSAGEEVHAGAADDDAVGAVDRVEAEAASGVLDAGQRAPPHSVARHVRSFRLRGARAGKVVHVDPRLSFRRNATNDETL